MRDQLHQIARLLSVELMSLESFIDHALQCRPDWQSNQLQTFILTEQPFAWHGTLLNLGKPK